MKGIIWESIAEVGNEMGRIPIKLFLFFMMAFLMAYIS